ncbi:hypothetical protein PV326_000545 [Microctonus aethiopoides]|nr:hypothetical protein PV326_000545 [Microctonus aethiopoides]
MSSQSVDINNTNTIVLINTSKYKSFIFDVELDISYTTDSVWSSYQHLWKTMLTTITCQIGHKYKNWRKCSYIIAERLCTKFPEANRSLGWKGTISVKGQYHDRDLDSNYSEIIHDCICYVGSMTIPENSDLIEKLESPPVCLQYTIRFFLSPALPSAQSIYCAIGYEKYEFGRSFNRRITDKRYNIEVDCGKEYNHLEVWQAAYKAHDPKYRYV